jgi:hypothetical protein
MIRADDRLLASPPVPVSCAHCGAKVLARKSSWQQTSVQWDTDATARCLERRDAQNLAACSGRGVFLACSALADSIVDAVRHGELPVIDETTVHLMPFGTH